MRGETKKSKKKISRKSLAILVVIAITIPLILTVSMVSFSGVDTSDGDTTYISASDILKNFKFESIGSEPIIAEGAFNNKLRFDTQASWVLYESDVTALDWIEDSGNTYLKYRIVLRNRLNFYTNVRLYQMASQMQPVSEDFLGVKYRHVSIWGTTSGWEEYITWEHWDFGDIYNWNWQNNYFSGRITMSFDIDDNPVPDTFGDYADKNFDHIAVSEAGIIQNTHGLMSKDMPTIVALSPSDYESEEKSETDFKITQQTIDDDDFITDLDPDIRLIVGKEPIQSFDSSILPDTAGSSMGPTNKNGDPIWDPEKEEKSMTGCKIYYDLNALSPVVYRYGGTLTYTEFDLKTKHEYTEDIWDWWETCVKVVHFYDYDRVEHGDIALHGINRYIQTDIYVAFDVWTSVTLGALTDYYEQMRLQAPEEYYDTLIWSTLAGGWTGSRIEEYGETGVDMFGWLDDIFGGLGGIITTVILIGVLLIGGYVFLVVGVPMLKARQKRKEMEEMHKAKSRYN